METQIPISSKIPNNIPENEVCQEQFLHTISQVTIQKWYSIVKIVVNNFSTNAAALINNGPV